MSVSSPLICDRHSSLTSESRVLSVGFTKSVVVTCPRWYTVYVMVLLILPLIVVITCNLGLKNSLTLKWSLLDSLTLEINFVLVWKALQGLVHGDSV